MTQKRYNHLPHRSARVRSIPAASPGTAFIQLARKDQACWNPVLERWLRRHFGTASWFT